MAAATTGADGSAVVADPELELHFPEGRAICKAIGVRGAGLDARTDGGVLVVLVEQRLPRKIEVHRETEQETLEPEAVGRAAVEQPDAADVRRRSKSWGERAG